MTAGSAPRQLSEEEALAALATLGFCERDARVLADHFLEADARGKPSHGTVRIGWLARRGGFDAAAVPTRLVQEEAYEVWAGNGAVGYLTMARICDEQLANPPERFRIVLAPDCAPTGMLGAWVRRLAEGGLVALLAATSELWLAHPDGGPRLAGTNPIAIGIPSSDGRPLVTDVSMSRVTRGDVLAGLASEDDLAPFGGEHAYKAFALAVGLQMLVESTTGTSRGAFLLVARPEADPVPALRARAEGVRLPGDRGADARG